MRLHVAQLALAARNLVLTYANHKAGCAACFGIIGNGDALGAEICDDSFTIGVRYMIA